ncbi:Predicted dehydrogenase [Pedobacter steynii]|uniref:Predicted dehydrogenase n=1 Tax=Pedobacter steynii TaxID=430522 RepID=A0A1G9WFW6_9SPHI|nr:Gfo/Idh/MocA family oxidoreductase [Pedobacter steynii]NQX40285.1 Gfo/Idh/MocA family oxidoreductase [Pedobacter steynii]SDM83370.1 Predicted dehydrogenase [Pedobacter steynii]
MNVLIIGLGSIAQKHINALKGIDPDVHFCALRSSTEAKEVDGVRNIYKLSALELSTIDFAIISNPTAYHQQTISTLIPYKIPLFIEKPVFDTLQIGTLLEEIAAQHTLTYVACNLRFLGCIAFVKQYIINKRINEVNSYCGSYLPDWRPGQDFRKIYSANIEMGGGVHIDLIHEMDYIYWLFGKPEEVTSTKANNSSLNISAMDYANYMLKYPEFCANIVLNYYRRDAKRSLEVLLDEGTIYVDLLENKVKYNGEIIYESDKNVLNTYEDQLLFFTEQVINNKVEFNSINEAFEVLKLCIAND